MTKNKPHIEVDAILERLMCLTKAKSDSELAGKLGVTRQVLSTWKKRKTIPYEKIVEFACMNDVSLDYLLLGKGKGDFSGGDIDPVLLESIEHELMTHGASVIHQLLPNYAHDISLIYNRVNRQLKPGAYYGELITDEVKYFLEIRRKYADQETKVVSKQEQPYVYDEEQRLFKKIGTRTEEVYGLPAANPIQDEGDDSPQVEEDIKGEGHRVTGRDIVNKGKENDK